MQAQIPHYASGKGKTYITKEVISMAKLTRLSTTITIGEGSEKHNHDEKYRAGLDHIKDAGREPGVIELIPYTKSYEQQINERRKAAIDRYNARVEARYEAAMERYKKGEIKSKPKRKDFKLRSYDYCKEWHEKHDGKPSGKRGAPKLWREMIIGFGDKSDRDSGRITQEQAVRIAQYVVDKWQENLPALPLMGAPLHTDETGFFHMHPDFDVFFEKTAANQRDLDVSSCFEDALEAMGIPAEQSIVNGRDKVPLRVNGLRNILFRWVEEAYQKEGILWDKGCTERKAPGKDSGVHTSLERWQATQDAERAIQAEKNEVLDVMLPVIQSGEPLTQEQIDHAAQHVAKMGQLMDEVAGTEYTFNRKERKLSVKLFDQLQSVWGHAAESFATLSKAVTDAIGDRDRWKARYEGLKAKANAKVGELAQTIEAWKAAYGKLEKENQALRDELAKYEPEEPQGLDALIGAAQLTPEQRRIHALERENAQMRAYMDDVQFADGTTVLEHYKEEAAQMAQERRRSGQDR